MTRLCRSIVVQVLISFVIGVRAAIDLPFGDINVLVVTDVHSWVAGHEAHNPWSDADYGDVLSFHEHLKQMAPNKDIWFVMNGDIIHGTGLSADPPKSLVPILQKMSWDAVSVGEHELQSTETIQFLTKPGGFVQWLGEKYVTSNTIVEATKEPLAKRYNLLKGQSSTLLVFGFIYDLTTNSPLVQVEKVEEAVQQQWFLDALGSKHDAILVLAHMDLEDQLVKVVLKAIRGVVGDSMPVQFITGHTHYRGFKVLDEAATSFEAGHFLDTLGFVSFPKQVDWVNQTSFKHTFLNASVETFASTLGIDVDHFSTYSGSSLSEFIERTRSHLGLTELVGCSPRRFALNSTLQKKSSLWALYKEEVLPTQFPVDDRPKIFVQSKMSTFMYDLPKGNITVDDVIAASPYNDEFFLLATDVHTESLLKLNETLNRDQDLGYLPLLPNYILIGIIGEQGKYDVYTTKADVETLRSTLSRILSKPVSEQVVDNVTTVGMWMDFIREVWPNCSSPWHLIDDEEQLEEEEEPRGELYKKGIVVILGGSVSFVLLSALVAMSASRMRRTKTEIANDPEEEVGLVVREVNGEMLRVI